ncbi:MAG TPA: hypothetical protein VF528_10630 [Pyrinomonadaceae bacterium]
MFAAKWLFLLSATGAKAFTTQYGTSRRRLEGDGVGFTTLVAGDVVALALTAASTAATAAAAKIRAARIPALLASFRLAQIAFLIIVLLALSKRKRISTLGADDLYVRHDRFLPEKAKAGPSELPVCQRGRALFGFLD